MGYYELLGIDKNASKDEIKKAYRKLSLQYHPDRPTGNSDKFKQIGEAYEILSDTEKKRMYDMRNGTRGGIPGMRGMSGMGGMPGMGDPENFFKMFFGGMPLAFRCIWDR